MDERIVMIHNMFLKSGHHTFKFEALFPEICPPSFESELGSIKYEAVIIISKGFHSQKSSMELNVLNPKKLSIFGKSVSQDF